ncbi:sensor histidine kinase [Paenibacillus marinisediminis]
MSLSKLWERIRIAFSILVAFGSVLLALAVAYWVTPYVLGLLDWNVTGFWAYILNGAMALIMLCIILAIMIPRALNKQNAFSQSIIDALKRISKGDFEVNIKTSKDFEGEFGTIIESIHEMAGELGQMEKMRQEFISNVSHEIQSPLTSIRGFAQALRSGEQLSAEERDHYLQIIETETMRLSKLSDNLLKLTALESEQQTLEITTYRLDQQLRNLVLACEPQWSQKQLDMELDLEKLTIAADEEMLSQVWMNLIHNAIKFTPDRGSIHIVMQGRQDQIEVRIKDTGIGIDEEHIPHIFERFFKSDTSRNRAKGGNGLGLSIVHKIIELHHGTIQVSSKRGSGTLFIIKIPADVVKAVENVQTAVN